jgi:hypothetical protein
MKHVFGVGFAFGNLLKSIPKVYVQTLGESRDEIVWVREKIS